MNRTRTKRQQCRTFFLWCGPHRPKYRCGSGLSDVSVRVCAPRPILTWKLEPLGHLSRVRSCRFSGLAACRWVLLVCCGTAGVLCRLRWRRRWRLLEAHRAGGSRRGPDHAAKAGWKNKKDLNLKYLTRRQDVVLLRNSCFYLKLNYFGLRRSWAVVKWDKDLKQRRSVDLIKEAKGQQVGVIFGKLALSLEGLENGLCVCVNQYACVEEMRGHGGTCCLGRTSKGFQWWQLCDRKIGWLPRDTSAYIHTQTHTGPGAHLNTHTHKCTYLAMDSFACEADTEDWSSSLFM